MNILNNNFENNELVIDKLKNDYIYCIDMPFLENKLIGSSNYSVTHVLLHDRLLLPMSV